MYCFTIQKKNQRIQSQIKNHFLKDPPQLLINLKFLF